MNRRVLSFDMGSRNMAFALIEHPTTVLRMGMIDLQKHAARQASETLLDTLITDNRWMLDEECPVVIELQPRSGVCKVLSHVLLTIFKTRDALLTPENPRPVIFMHAMRKFAIDRPAFVQLNPQTYPERKQAAVDIAKCILRAQNTPVYLAFFEDRSAKQQTDLADAILQGCSYLIA